MAGVLADRGPIAADSTIRSRHKKKGGPDALAGDGTQQPAQVVAGRAADDVQRITQRALQPAAVQPVIGFHVSDRRLDRLAPAQPAFVSKAQALELATMDDLLAGVVIVHTPEAQIGDDVGDVDAHILRYVGCLLQHRAQDVPIVGVAGEGARAQAPASVTLQTRLPHCAANFPPRCRGIRWVRADDGNRAALQYLLGAGDEHSLVAVPPLKECPPK